MIASNVTVESSWFRQLSRQLFDPTEGKIPSRSIGVSYEPINPRRAKLQSVLCDSFHSGAYLFYTRTTSSSLTVRHTSPPCCTPASTRPSNRSLHSGTAGLVQQDGAHQGTRNSACRSVERTSWPKLWAPLLLIPTPLPELTKTGQHWWSCQTVWSVAGPVTHNL